VALPDFTFSDAGVWDFSKQQGRLQLWPPGTHPMEKWYTYVVTISWEDTSATLEAYASEVFGHIDVDSDGLVSERYDQSVGKCAGKAAKLKLGPGDQFSTEREPYVIVLATTSQGKGFELACRAADALWVGDCEKALRSFSIASCN
jgi:hypothetical protein